MATGGLSWPIVANHPIHRRLHRTTRRWWLAAFTAATGGVVGPLLGRPGHRRGRIGDRRPTPVWVRLVVVRVGPRCGRMGPPHVLVLPTDASGGPGSLLPDLMIDVGLHPGSRRWWLAAFTAATGGVVGPLLGRPVHV